MAVNVRDLLAAICILLQPVIDVVYSPGEPASAHGV